MWEGRGGAKDKRQSSIVSTPLPQGSHANISQNIKTRRNGKEAMNRIKNQTEKTAGKHRHSLN